MTNLFVDLLEVRSFLSGGDTATRSDLLLPTGRPKRVLVPRRNFRSKILSFAHDERANGMALPWSTASVC